MKPAEEWCEDMFGRNNWVVADGATIRAIQEDARKDLVDLLFKARVMLKEDVEDIPDESSTARHRAWLAEFDELFPHKPK